jgi:cell wall-associated NlpC family hydrolase
MIPRAALLPAIVGMLAVGGCGPKPIYRTSPLEARGQPQPPPAPEETYEPTGPLETALSAAADTWLGVPYRYGGTTRSGIDCSALAAEILDEVGVSLPRSVSEQRSVGEEVPPGDVSAGDLVFFRLDSSRVNHVGVALDESHFVHASRSRGVTIDRLDDTYYHRCVAETRRVLDALPASDGAP